MWARLIPSPKFPKNTEVPGHWLEEATSALCLHWCGRMTVEGEELICLSHLSGNSVRLLIDTVGNKQDY